MIASELVWKRNSGSEVQRYVRPSAAEGSLSRSLLTPSTGVRYGVRDIDELRQLDALVNISGAYSKRWDFPTRFERRTLSSIDVEHCEEVCSFGGLVLTIAYLTTTPAGEKSLNRISSQNLGVAPHTPLSRSSRKSRTQQLQDYESDAEFRVTSRKKTPK